MKIARITIFSENLSCFKFRGLYIGV